MSARFENRSNDDVVQVVNLANLRKNFHVEDEINGIDIRSLGTMLFTEESPISVNTGDDDSFLQRLSLAHERLHSMPKILLEEIAPDIKILDISHNEFENLDFLKEFNQLSHLICDHNDITCRTDIPFLPTLELLWMNHCKIFELVPWITNLKNSCPNLKYLSLMENPFSMLHCNSGTDQKNNYRLLIIFLFPKLLYLDDVMVTMEEREEARKKFHESLIEQLVRETQKQLPDYLRGVTEKISTKLSSTFKSGQERNVLI